MRAAAVQLNATADKAAQPRDGRPPRARGRGRRRRARRAAREVDGARHAARTCARGAEPLDGPALDLGARRRARAAASTSSPARSSERVDGRGQARATRRVHVGPDGELRARLPQDAHVRRRGRRRRLPRVRRTRSPGDEAVAHAAAGGVELGLTVCYDLRFPELYRVLAVRGARDPRACPPRSRCRPRATTGRSLLRARAIENQAFVVAANQIGEHAAGPALRRALADRRPVGHRARQRARRRGRRRRRPRPRRAGRDPRATAVAGQPPAGGLRRAAPEAPPDGDRPRSRPPTSAA